MLEHKDLTASYDALSYPNDAHFATDPAALTAAAKLHCARLSLDAKFLLPSLRAPDFEGVRMLEIGCALGGNLIPLAAKYPKMQCVGVDLSSAQIARARQDAEALELKNVEFYAASILDLPLAPESFDLIVAHGVFSWVSADIAQEMMIYSAGLLKTHGLLYLSYNTLPGWYQEKAIRDMMAFHASDCSSSHDEISSAREMLDMTSRFVTDAHYRHQLQEEKKVVDNVPDAYIYHEYLETFNEPYYLKDVVASAQNVGLSYLGDSNLNACQTPPEVESFIQKQLITGSKLPLHVLKEQYQDFFTNRSFRQSVFVKGTLPKAKNEKEKNLSMLFFLLSANLSEPLSRFELKKAKKLSLMPLHNENADIVKELTDSYAVAVMVFLLTQTVKPFSYEALLNGTSLDKKRLEEVLKFLIGEGLVRVLSQPLNKADFSNNPNAWRVSRYYASIDKTSVNYYHRNIQLDLASRRLLCLCDGTRKVSALAEMITDEILQAKEDTATQTDDYPFVLLGEKMRHYSDKECKELVQFFVDDALIQFSGLGVLTE